MSEAVIAELHEILGKGDLPRLVREMVEESNALHKKVAHYKTKFLEIQTLNNESNKEVIALQEELRTLKGGIEEPKAEVSPDNRYAMLEAELRAAKADSSRLDQESRQLSRSNLAAKSRLHTLEEESKQQLAALQATVNSIDNTLKEEGITIHDGDRVSAIRMMRKREAELLQAANDGRREAEESRDSAITELMALRSELLWRKRAPYSVCGLKLMPRKPPSGSQSGSPQRSGSVDSYPEDTTNEVSVSIVDVSPVLPPRRIEVRLPTRSIKYTFDEVLPAWSDLNHIMKSATDVIAAGFSGIYSSLVMIPADSSVNAMVSPNQLHSVASEVMACADRSRELHNWSWNIHFSCIELRTDTIRDLLNSDSDYIRAQNAGGHNSVPHEVQNDKGIPIITECASPSVKSASKLSQLLDIAFGNRSTTPDGELRGHTAYIFGMSGSKNNGRNHISGSFTIIDLAADATLPVEIPPGSTVDNKSVVGKSIEQRERERRYVRKSLSQLQALFDLHKSTTDAVYEEKQRPKLLSLNQPTPSPYRRKGYTGEQSQTLTVGQEVIIQGLVSPEYSHLNGVRGIVLGRSDYEEDTPLVGRIMVELSHELTLPFMFANLVPVPPGLETSNNEKVSHRSASPSVASRSDFNGRHSATSTTTKKSLSKRQKASKSVELSHQESNYNIQRSHLNQLIKPCLAGGVIASVLRLPTECTEPTCSLALKLSEKLSHCYLKELVIHESGSST